MTVRKQPMMLALRLIEKGQYDQAKLLLCQVSDNPAAQRWLARLERMGSGDHMPKGAAPLQDPVEVIRAQIHACRQEVERLDAAIAELQTLINSDQGGLRRLLGRANQDKQRRQELERLQGLRLDQLDVIEYHYTRIWAARHRAAQTHSTQRRAAPRSSTAPRTTGTLTTADTLHGPHRAATG